MWPPYSLIQTIDQAHTKGASTYGDAAILSIISLPDGKLVTSSWDECKIWRPVSGKFVEIRQENCGQGILLTDGRLVCAEINTEPDPTCFSRGEEYCPPTFNLKVLHTGETDGEGEGAAEGGGGGGIQRPHIAKLSIGYSIVPGKLVVVRKCGLARVPWRGFVEPKHVYREY